MTQADTVTEAGRIAGYADRNAAYTALKNAREKLQGELEKQGVAAEAVVRNCLLPAVTVMSVERGWKNGVCIQEKYDIDSTTRLRVAALVRRTDVGKVRQASLGTSST